MMIGSLVDKSVPDYPGSMRGSKVILCSLSPKPPQESNKVSDLNPNAKAWASHMLNLDTTGPADTTPSLQPWKGGCDGSADPGPEGQPFQEVDGNSPLTVWLQRCHHSTTG